MGWRGTMRSIAAAARAAERDAQRQHKAAVKAQISADSADAVDAWHDYIDNLISVHVNLADGINWKAIASQEKPQQPNFLATHEQKAKTALENFKPGFMDFLSGGSKKRKEKLIETLAYAPAKDQEAYKQEQYDYQSKLAEWEEETVLARKLIVAEKEALLKVINEFQSFEQEALIGSAVSFEVSDGFVHAMPEVHSDEIVPNYRRKQLASGKLSESKMPTGQFNELYQDYVCSVALKVAGDLFQILPLDEVYVTCKSLMLNSKTGHQELTPILSVQFVRPTFEKLNLRNLDPSDSMENFNHAMSFKKTKGLSQITPISPVLDQ